MKDIFNKVITFHVKDMLVISGQMEQKMRYNKAQIYKFNSLLAVERSWANQPSLMNIF